MNRHAYTYLAALLLTVPTLAMEKPRPISIPSPSALAAIKTVHHSVGSMAEAVQLVSEVYGGKGTVVALDFDDTLFSKETEFENGQVIRYLEKSTFSDLALNGGAHPVFEAVTQRLGLNLLETNQSFKSIRRHFLAQSPELPLNVREERYYSVEEQKTTTQLQQSIQALQDPGALICIVSAAGGGVNPLKIDHAQSLGIKENRFLRGYKKFDQVAAFLDGLSKEGQGEGKSRHVFHTFILIDDTVDYINTWERHGKTIPGPQHSWLPTGQDVPITVVGIHYDFLGQQAKFVEEKMVEEFLALYGKGYRSHPLMQPFLKAPFSPRKKEHPTSCFFPFLGK